MDKDFRGNAYIVKEKEVLLNYSGGYADLANEIPNTIDTRFASASMSKTFVAVGILQLIEAEKLRFEDTIGSILDFDVYLKQNVFDRCSMSNTGYYSFDKLPAKCANSYIYSPDTDDYRTNI
jgi:CubicO group peptidase (beta-lactamase class C family)